MSLYQSSFFERYAQLTEDQRCLQATVVKETTKIAKNNFVDQNVQTSNLATDSEIENIEVSVIEEVEEEENEDNEE